MGKTGRHHIRYALLPHSGPLSSTTIKTAFNFNNPLKVYYHPSPSVIAPLLGAFRITGSDTLVLDTVKRAEDDEDVSRGELPRRKGRSVVLRIYDAMGGRTRGRVEWGDLDVKKVLKCNLLEDDLEEVESGKGGMDIVVGTFEVVSFRLILE